MNQLKWEKEGEKCIGSSKRLMREEHRKPASPLNAVGFGERQTLSHSLSSNLDFGYKWQTQSFPVFRISGRSPTFLSFLQTKVIING